MRCKRQDLTSEEIQLHLSTGKLVTQAVPGLAGQAVLRAR